MVDKSFVLQVKSLRTYFTLDEGILKAVDGASFVIPKQTTLGIIGESGCGKSVIAQSVLRIVPQPGRIEGGEILLNRDAETRMDTEKPEAGRPRIVPQARIVDLARIDPGGPAIRAIRGKEISMIFQEPMTSLSPVHTIGAQITEAILLHKTRDKGEARERALDMINRVGISNPSQRIDDYPHQLSGGMRQRAMIAMALSCSPRLLIADEPTTALDVTVQAQILDLMQHLQEQLQMSIMYITHDLGVIAEMAHEVNVLYLGRIVEKAPASELFERPLHPYTRLLLKSIPKVGRKARARLDAIQGTVPVPINLPRRCGFFGRCPEAITGVCDRALPGLADAGSGHLVRCFLHSEEREPENE